MSINNANSEEQYKLKQQFLDEWSLERVRSMKLEEYTNLNRDDSFCYWVESKTRILGSIQGGTSYKFGIYERENTDTVDTRDAYLTDGKYAWLRKYGETKEQAFQSVKNIVSEVAEAAINDKLEAIDGIDLGDAYKWKIAFLYSDYKVINIFSAPNIRWSGKYKGFKEADTSVISEIHRFLIDEKPSELDFYKYSKSLWSAFDNREEDKEPITHENINFPLSLNQILYGPPGTGKTYHTKNKAVAIIKNDDQYLDDSKYSRDEINRLYDQYKANNQLRFVTFHPSYTYEDFVEGIKPEIQKDDQENDGELKYIIESGIFKGICESAKAAKNLKSYSIPEEITRTNQVHKISLGDSTNPEDDQIYKYCIDNGLITIGYLHDVDLSNASTKHDIIYKAEEKGYSPKDFGVDALHRFIHRLKEGDVVFVSEGNTKLRAIGVIRDKKGEGYFYDTERTAYNHFRHVEWVLVDQEIPVNDVYYKRFNQQPIYSMINAKVKWDYFKQVEEEEGIKRFVLIIDEINRGNIPSIFGELITLIEPDKRECKDEALSVELPYSKESFSVPENVHIIGTMNTADRSVEALDIALRRRFEFSAYLPDSSIIKQPSNLDVNLKKMLDSINDRIRYLLDVDHTIGHSYFMDLWKLDDPLKGLKGIFKNKVLPLLEEYFYGQTDKIGLILGSAFVEKEEGKTAGSLFTNFTTEESIPDRRLYRIVNPETFDNSAPFKAIYE